MPRLTPPRKSHDKTAENVSAILLAIAAACNAYAKWVEWQLTTHKETTTNALEDEMDRLLKCLEAGINVKIITGTRTYNEQDNLYAQGRTKAGRKVTNAPAGYSWHNFGVAWDFVVFDANGEPQWESPLMEECGKIAESLGHEWGGRWTSPQDTPHVTVKMGCTLADARQRVKEGKWWT